MTAREPDDCGRDVAAGCRNGGKGAEGFSGSSGTVVVDPGLRQHAGFGGGRGLRRARRPEAQFGSLDPVRVGSGYIDDEGIGRHLDVGGEAHSAAVLDERSVVQIETAAEILRRGERREAGYDKLAGGVSMGQGVFTVQLCREPILRTIRRCRDVRCPAASLLPAQGWAAPTQYRTGLTGRRCPRRSDRLSTRSWEQFAGR